MLLQETTVIRQRKRTVSLQSLSFHCLLVEIKPGNETSFFRVFLPILACFILTNGQLKPTRICSSLPGEIYKKKTRSFMCLIHEISVPLKILDIQRKLSTYIRRKQMMSYPVSTIHSKLLQGQGWPRPIEESPVNLQLLEPFCHRSHHTYTEIYFHDYSPTSRKSPRSHYGGKDINNGQFCNQSDSENKCFRGYVGEKQKKLT